MQPSTYQSEIIKASQPTVAANNCSSADLDLVELEEKIKRGFNLTRDFYDCGKALTLVRDSQPPLYYPEFSTFEDYCLKRFRKSVRAAQYFMSAAALVDNLVEAECSIIPTAESQVRAIASLPANQQIEIWQHACTNSNGKVPTATQVKSSRAEILSEPLPDAPASPPATSDEGGETESDNQTTARAIPKLTNYKVLPQPAALLERLRSRIKSSKATLEDMQVVLELIPQMTESGRLK